jgi:transcriptional regulator with XRE-family HTH domain
MNKENPFEDRNKQHEIMIGRRLRSIRKQRGMTLKQVATQMLEKDGLTEDHPKWEATLASLLNKISRNETGARTLRYPFAGQLALVLDFDVNMLFSRSEVTLDSLAEQRLFRLSDELLDALDKAREQVEEKIGINNLSNEQLVEYLARNFCMQGRVQ